MITKFCLECKTDFFLYLDDTDKFCKAKDAGTSNCPATHQMKTLIAYGNKITNFCELTAAPVDLADKPFFIKDSCLKGNGNRYCVECDAGKFLKMDDDYVISCAAVKPPIECKYWDYDTQKQISYFRDDGKVCLGIDADKWKQMKLMSNPDELKYGYYMRD